MTKVVGNIAWLAADQILRLLLGVFLNAWTARYLNVDGYGLFNYGLNVVTIAAFAYGFGIDSIVVRELVKSPLRSAQILGSALVLKLLSSVLIIVGSVGFVLVVNPDLPSIGLISFVFSAAYLPQCLDVINLYYQSRLQASHYVIPRFIGYCIAAGYRIFLLAIGADIASLASVGFVEMLVGGSLVATWYIREVGAKGHLKFDRQLALSLPRDSWPFMVSSLSALVYMRIGQIMLANMAGLHDQGLYSAAVRISEMWYFLPGAIVNSLSPGIIRLKRDDPELYLARLQQLYAVMSLIGIVAAVSITVLAKPIILLLYGVQYASSALVLSIHVWAGVFVCQGVARSQWILAENRTILSLFATLAGALVSIVLNLLLIPGLRGEGAAISLLVAQCVAAVVSTLFMNRQMFFMQLKSFVFVGLRPKELLSVIRDRG